MGRRRREAEERAGYRGDPARGGGRGSEAGAALGAGSLQELLSSRCLLHERSAGWQGSSERPGKHEVSIGCFIKFTPFKSSSFSLHHFCLYRRLQTNADKRVATLLITFIGVWDSQSPVQPNRSDTVASLLGVPSWFF